ncbi:c-type cytochrome biogenesis protein CcmI [Alphaproteobacteria bacterium]|jgi:cytochrome c-type biogenesis protein CcmH|nr:c-type cytochrome biogenesis protein CcmI [Alphaproteobacteria bacterium]
MIVLVSAILTIVIVCAVFLLWPIKPQVASPIETSGKQLSLLKQELLTLEQGDASQFGSDKERQQAITELKRRILKAAQQQQETQPVSNGRFGYSVYGVLVGLVSLVLILFWWVSSPSYTDQALYERMDVRLAKSETVDELDEIATDLEAVVADGNGTGQTYYLLGDTYRRLGRFSEASIKFTQAYEANYAPFQSLMAIAETAIAEQQGGVNDVARQALSKAAELDGKNLRLQFYRGAILAQDGEFDNALGLWENLRAKSSDPELNRQLDINIQAIKKGLNGDQQPGPSQEDIVAAQDMTADDRQSMIEGMVERLAGKLEEDPSDVDGWLRLIRAYLVLEKRTEAEVAIHSLLEQSADHPMGLFMLGKLSAERGDKLEARTAWEKVLKQIPEDRPEHATLKKQIEALEE